jgi:replicative DNA helicase
MPDSTELLSPPKPGTFTEGAPSLQKMEKGGAAQHKGAAPSDIHRPLPSSVDAEKGVLSAILQSPADLIGVAVETLNPEAFYVPAHRMIYDVLLKLGDSGQPIDAISLQEALIKDKLLDKVGGPTTVVDLLSFVPDAAHFEFYRDLIKEKWLLRRIIGTCTECTTDAYDNPSDPQVILDTVEQKILDIGDSQNSELKVASMKENVWKAVEKIEYMFENRGKVTGLSTGFRDLDKRTNGLHPGQMIVIAARPGMGKTSFAMNIAENVAVLQEKPVAIFSLEMGTDELVQRLLFSRARVDAQKLRDGMPEKSFFPKLMNAADELAKAKMFIDDTPGISILEMRAKARRMKREGIVMIVVDYLQLMKSTSKRAQENRQLEISEISAGLKGLAKELSIPIIVLAQLNRGPEQRGGGQPRISDLRESGSIEQDADVVGLLMRPERYADDEDEREELAGKATLIIAKQRNGPTGEIPLTFIGSQTRFADAAYEDDQN